MSKFDFDAVVRGSSANTGRAVIPIGGGASETDRLDLELPDELPLSQAELVKLLNQRFRQIEDELGLNREYEASLAIKMGYGSLAGIGATATPVAGAKIVLDKIGSWLLLICCEWERTAGATVTMMGCAVIDPETTAQAKAQAACAKALLTANGKHSTTGWGLFTATEIPRLVQLYAKQESGSATVNLLQGGTHIAGIWLGRWEPEQKRFGRHTPNAIYGEDASGAPLTNYGEQARFPRSDDPATMPNGVNQPGL